MTLTTLLPRLEAGEASRELDALLWCLYDPRPLEQTDDGPAIWKRDPVDTIAFDGPPPFTTSLDAALALAERVLPGCMWRVGFDPDDGSMKAEIVTSAPKCISAKANHDTAALALCAAIVKARMTQEEAA